MSSVLKENKEKKPIKRQLSLLTSIWSSQERELFSVPLIVKQKVKNIVKVISPTIAVTQHGCFLFLALKLFLFQPVLI